MVGMLRCRIGVVRDQPEAQDRDRRAAGREAPLRRKRNAL